MRQVWITNCDGITKHDGLQSIQYIVGSFGFTEVNELKNICIAIFRLMFNNFRMQIFHIYNLESKWQN